MRGSRTCASRRSASPSRHLPEPESPAAIPLESEDGVTASAGRRACRATVGHAGTSRTSAITTSRTFRGGCDTSGAQKTRTGTWRWGAPRARSSSSARLQEFRRAIALRRALTWLWADPWAAQGGDSVDVAGVRRARGTACVALAAGGDRAHERGARRCGPARLRTTRRCQSRARCTSASCAMGGTSRFAASVPARRGARMARRRDSIDSLLGRFTDACRTPIASAHRGTTSCTPYG